MALPRIDGTFTGALRIDAAVRFDDLSAGGSRPLVALGEAGAQPVLALGQLGQGPDLYFDLIQGGDTYRVVAQDVLTEGTATDISATIDDTGRLTLTVDDVLVAQMQAVVPLALPLDDLRGAPQPGDPEIIDLTIEPLSPAPPDGNMVVVAHQDDDLLFMNPTINEEIAEGTPVTTVYLTSGDAGQDEAYWQGREAGVKAAYALMAGADGDAWVDEIVTLNLNGEAVEVASSYLDTAPHVRLYFLRTPDGIDGGGTPTYGFGSLELLWDGDIASVTTVDGANTYTGDELTGVIAALMDRHMPQDILLQDDSTAIEHSDHVHTADFAEAALALHGEDVTVTRFLSYSSWGEEENLTPEEIALVTTVFETYAAFDPEVVDATGAIRPPYTDWVQREYVSDQYSLVDGERVDGPLPDRPGPIDPDPVDPGPSDPDPTDPGPSDPAPADPPEGPEDPVADDPPQDPGTGDPTPGPDAPEDPAPPNPTSPPTEEPAPTSPDWTADLYGEGGALGDLLSGGFWGGAPSPAPGEPVPTDPPPTDPDPSPDPADPSSPDPETPSGPATPTDAFGPGGAFEAFLGGNLDKWSVEQPQPDPSPAPPPVEPAPAPLSDPFASDGLYAALMQDENAKWEVGAAPDDDAEEDDVSDL